MTSYPDCSTDALLIAMAIFAAVMLIGALADAVKRIISTLKNKRT